MAKTEHYYTTFEEAGFYHIYNRSIDKQPMFKTEANYFYFLKQYDKYLSPVTDTFAYCLLGNHFHILLRVKPDLVNRMESQLDGTYVRKENESLKSAHDIVSHQFRKFFQSYAMAFNKQQDRVGTLFQTPFKRVAITDDDYFTQIIYYIHSNPQRHNLIADFRKWKWSSYNKILLEKPTNLKKQEVLEWFGGKKSYEQYHASVHQFLNQERFIIE